MIDPNLNENIVRILGSISIERELEIGRDYEIKVTASCTEKAKVDNNDGTFNFKHKLRLITGEIINDRGQSLRLNIKSSWSQKLRRRIFAMGLDYEKIMPFIVSSVEEIIERYVPKR